MQTSPVPPNRQESSSPRVVSSLVPTTSMNVADQARASSTSYSNRGSPRLDRRSSDRRSQGTMHINSNDPTIPGMGEQTSNDHRTSTGHSFAAASPLSLGGRGMIATGDPHHQRQPSLGDIHNELEQEQEAQVNRMLQMIRLQQEHLEAMQRSQQDIDQRPSSTSMASIGTAIVDDPTPGSERSFSIPRNSNHSRNASSANRSPALRPLPSTESHTGIDNWPSSPLDAARRNSSRDESAYYQAETANLTRENQMLKWRIRELESQLTDMNERASRSPL